MLPKMIVQLFAFNLFQVKHLMTIIAKEGKEKLKLCKM